MAEQPNSYLNWTNRRLRARIIGGCVFFLVGLLFVLALDSTLFHWFRSMRDRFSDNFLELFKAFGFWGFWVLAAAGLILQDLPLQGLRGWQSVFRRAGFLLSSALLSGFAAEILKLFIRRERPQGALFSDSTFRAWSGDWWKSNDLSTPSSHAAVAFGAAWALWFLFPRPKLVWFFLACACGFSRIVESAHLPSDIYVAAWLSFVVTYWLRRVLGVEKIAKLEGGGQC